MKVKIYVADAGFNTPAFLSRVLILVQKSLLFDNCTEQDGWMTGELADGTDDDITTLQQNNYRIEKVVPA
ncbi:hypothetical protein KKF61_06680 [Patescibacteria group bacterium]|nr:hypothetical protein [Patescibacteria group bacterium]MBU0964627.1 hypothetical protein [Patescibacteria group bacterium]